MDFLLSLDIALFRFINDTLQNPVFDAVMPFISYNALFIPVVALLAIGLIWKGGSRGRLFVFMLLVVISLGDGWICNTLKKTIARPRPFLELADVHLLVGKGGSGSMPSSHAANWFSALAVAFLFYPRSWRFVLPLAVAVAFSRVYNGVHYPGDVLAGAILGMGYGFAFVWLVNSLWRCIGQKWFPLWFEKLPSLVPLPNGEAPKVTHHASRVTPDQHFLHLGYLIIAALLVFRWSYINSGKIELSEDEAYQWLWSKHLALSYYSKPPMIAYLQWIGTSLFGDKDLGVRFFSPLISAILSFLTLRFMAREVNARAGLFTVLILNTTLILAGGSLLMTIDPPLILFWTAAMFAGWKAIQADGKTSHWLWAGLFLGLSFLSKYAALYQIICWALFFILWKPARVHLRKPGPYLALFIFALCMIPVLIWNAQNQWITVHHVGDNAGRTDAWKPTLKYFLDFIGGQLALQNPIYFVATIWAMIAFWKRPKTKLHIFLFCMGGPVLIGYTLFTGYKRVFPNWIAPAILPLFCLAVLYWEQRWREGARAVKRWLIAGLVVGLVFVIVGHDSNVIGKITGKNLPGKLDFSRRVRGWKDSAALVGEMRDKLAAEGKPTFVIGGHYGIVGQTSFYLPEAREGAQQRQPLIYYQSSKKPENQLYFWPEYQYVNHRKGQNAIYVREVSLKRPENSPPPAFLKAEFESVEDWGQHDVLYRGRVFHRYQFYACRDLK